jgi:hypothetical protein
MKKWCSIFLSVVMFTQMGLFAAPDKKSNTEKTPASKTASTSKKTKSKKDKTAKYHFKETIHMSLPQNILNKWKLGVQKADKDKGTAVTRYILEKESIDKWSELVNIQFKDKKLVTAKSAEEAMKEEASKSKNVTSKVHYKNPHDVLYEREFPTGEHEIVRMILTRTGLHRVAYIKRGPLTNEDRTQWVELLSKGMIGGRES